MCNFIAVRHGERLDKADEGLWQSMVANSGLSGKAALYFSQDPPLTEEGVSQAQEMARSIVLVVGRINKPVQLYSSKLLRSIGTAVAIARELSIPVYLCSGLSLVIPEVKRSEGQFKFKSIAELNSTFPGVTFVDCDRSTENAVPSSSWPAALKAILSKGDKLSIVVGHGETLKSLIATKVKTPYCCYGLFSKTATIGSRPSVTASRNASTEPKVNQLLTLIGIKDCSGQPVSQSSR